MTEKIYTMSEAAERLKISKPSLYKLMNGGKLDFFWVGGLRRVTDGQIAKYISENGSTNTLEDAVKNLKDIGISSGGWVKSSDD